MYKVPIERKDTRCSVRRMKQSEGVESRTERDESEDDADISIRVNTANPNRCFDPEGKVQDVFDSFGNSFHLQDLEESGRTGYSVPPLHSAIYSTIELNKTNPAA